MKIGRLKNNEAYKWPSLISEYEFELLGIFLDFFGVDHIFP